MYCRPFHSLKHAIGIQTKQILNPVEASSKQLLPPLPKPVQLMIIMLFYDQCHLEMHRGVYLMSINCAHLVVIQPYAFVANLLGKPGVCQTYL